MEKREMFYHLSGNINYIYSLNDSRVFTVSASVLLPDGSQLAINQLICQKI